MYILVNPCVEQLKSSITVCRSGWELMSINIKKQEHIPFADHHKWSESIKAQNCLSIVWNMERFPSAQ